MAWLWGSSVAGVLLRAGGVAIASAALMLLGRRKPSLATYVQACAYMLVLGYATWELTLAFDGENNGRILGHESVAVAMLWSAYGAATVLVLPRIRHPWAMGAGRVVVLLGLGWLMFGGLMANARWAFAWVRIVGYAVVFGAIWGVEGLPARRAQRLATVQQEAIPAGVRAPAVRPSDHAAPPPPPTDDVQGLLSVVAVLAGALVVVPFEVERTMETLFHLYGVGRIAEWYLATQAHVTTIAWSSYGLLMAAAGLAVRSYRTWLLGLASFVGGGGYFLLFALTRTEGLGWMRLTVWILLPLGTLLLFMLWWWGRPAHRSSEQVVPDRFAARG